MVCNVGLKMKLITSTDLQVWGNTRESEEKLPLLLRRLIINNIGFDNIQFIDIPGGDSIWKPGADGKVVTKKSSILGDENKTYIIECGQSKDVERKFQDDLEKRSNQLSGRTDAIFCFITTYKLKDKNETLKKIKQLVPNSNLWSEIKIFDADNIETWLEHDHATMAWLADILGKTTYGVKSFERYWDTWQKSTIPSIDEDIILARGNVYLKEITQWLLRDDGILKIKSASRKESILIFLSAILKSGLNANNIDAIKSKIVIVEDAARWDPIVEHKESQKLIIIPAFGIPFDLGARKDSGYKIFIPYGEEDGKNNEQDMLYIEEFNNSILYPVLQQKVNSYEKANNIIQRLGHKGTLLHLQRILERADAPLPQPKWANKDNWRILLFAALIGSWNENNIKDKEAISAVFGMEYIDITRKLSLYIKSEEAPITKIGHTWEVSAPDIIVNYLGGYLTKDIFDEYIKKTGAILSVIDPKYNNPQVGYFLSGFDFNTKQFTYYSNNLIEGICQGYAILRAFCNIFDSTLMVSSTLDMEIKDIFFNKDWKTWATLSRGTALLAEAAPNSFLESLTGTIRNNPNVIKDIYTHSVETNSSLGVECLYLGILSSLEVLSWVDTYFVQSIQNLIELEVLKTIDTKIINSPLQSLKEIFCPWYPNTLVGLDGKKQVLEKLIKDNKNMDVVFSLLLSLFYSPHQISSHTQRPRFIDIVEPSNITIQELNCFYDFIFQKTLSILGENSARWEKMIRNISFMNTVNFNKFKDTLNSFDWPNVNTNFRTSIYQSLTHYVQYLEQLSENKKEENAYIDKSKEIKKILERLEVTDPIEKNMQLFSNVAMWHNEEESSKPKAELQEAIKEIIDKYGIDGILTFATKIDAPHILGMELAYINLKDEDIKALFNNSNKENNKIRHLLANFLARIIYLNGVSVLDDIFNKTWDIEYQKFILLSINTNKEYWSWLERNNLTKIYWENVEFISADTDLEYGIALEQLKKFKNYNSMLQLISRQLYMKKEQRVKTEDIICVLEGLLTTRKQITSNLAIYELGNVFKILQKRSNVDERVLFNLELAYFDLFNDYNKLEPVTVYKILKTTPAFVIEIISNIFSKKDNIEESSEQEKNIVEKRNKIALKLYMKLEKTFPFNNRDEFMPWIDGMKVRLESLKNSDEDLYRLGIQMIGKILANSPKDPEDNIWPIRYVRDVIEDLDCEDLRIGISLGKANAIGVRIIDRKDPGGDYRQWASEFKNAADKLRFQYPNTAKVLETLSKEYLITARQEKEFQR